MSLVTIPEACNLKYGIEVEGFVKSMSKPICRNIGIDYVYCVCNAILCDGKCNMINIAMWDSDISKVRNNLKIRIKDAKLVIYNGKKFLYRTKIGRIIVLDFNPNSISEDIINLKERNKINSFKKSIK